MEYFEIGSYLKSYSELVERLNKYCNTTNTRFFKKNSRFINSAINTSAKKCLVYSELKFTCIHSGVSRSRRERNSKLECPAYFRLKLVQCGTALQIVALNNKHSHPLDITTYTALNPKVLQ